jgi:hypothetical protein
MKSINFSMSLSFYTHSYKILKFATVQTRSARRFVTAVSSENLISTRVSVVNFPQRNMSAVFEAKMHSAPFRRWLYAILRCLLKPDFVACFYLFFRTSDDKLVRLAKLGRNIVK